MLAALNGIPQLPTPSRILFSLPNIRENISMKSLKRIMSQDQYEQVIYTAPKPGIFPPVCRRSQLRLLLAPHPRHEHTPHTRKHPGQTAASNQGFKATKTRQTPPPALGRRTPRMRALQKSQVSPASLRRKPKGGRRGAQCSRLKGM